VERAEDIEMLIEYFLRKISHEMQGPVLSITRPAVDRMLGHRWPGNVRELQNVLRRGMIVCKGELLELNESWIQKKDLPPKVESQNVAKPDEEEELQSLDEVEEAHIMKVLRHTRGNYGEACRILGISRPTLRRKISEYNLLVELDD